VILMKRLCLPIFLLLPVIAATQTITPGSIIGNGNLTQQIITTGTTYTPAAGVTMLEVVMVGGGPGGGGCAAAIGAASGGAAAAILYAFLTTDGTPITYSIGTKGNGGTAGNNNGGTAGDTVFGTLTAKAGVVGNGVASGNGAAPAVGAVQLPVLAPTGTNAVLLPVGLPITGNAGVTSTGGNGGRTIWGNGGTGGATAIGGNATGFGAGGGGAGCTVGSGALKGGDGSPGAIVVIAPVLGTSG